MWRLEKSFCFEASHVLPSHDGKCARLHGHSWRATLVVEGVELQDSGPKSGMVCDYADLKAAVEPLREQYLDHHHLNDSTGIENPTSEELCRWIYHRVKKEIPQLAAVIVEETCTSRCEYRP
jgi:6-pyruvoyltetrahydropterin/6-carboxytetrahydropterin synthase